RLAEVDLHEGNTSLDEPATEQEALAHEGPAVSVADPRILAREVKRITAGGGREDFHRPAAEVIELRRGGRAVELAPAVIGGRRERRATLEPVGREPFRKRQVGRAECAVGGIADQVPRVKPSTKEAGVLARECRAFEREFRGQNHGGGESARRG